MVFISTLCASALLSILVMQSPSEEPLAAPAPSLDAVGDTIPSPDTLSPVARDSLESSQLRSHLLSYEKKSPAGAAVLSYLFAGLGQFYNGEPGKGVAYALGYGISLGVGTAGLFTYFSAYERSLEKWRLLYPDKARAGAIIFVSGLTLGSGTMIWSVVDAAVSANRINKARKEQNLGFDVVPRPDGIGAQLTLRF